MPTLDTSRSFVDVMRRRALPAIVTFVLLLALALIASRVIHPKYAAYAHVLLVNDQSGRDPANAGADMPTIVTSSSILEHVKRELSLAASVTDMRTAITAHVAPKSSIMTISYRDRSPDLAVAVPNAVADAFVAFYAGLPSSRFASVTTNLHRDLDTKRANVLDLERRLERAASGESYVGSQASLDETARRLGELVEMRGAAQGQLVGDVSALRSNTAAPGVTSKNTRAEILQSNPFYKQMAVDVARDASNYEQYRSSVSAAYPGVAGYSAKIRNELQSLQQTRSAALAGPDAYSPSLAGQQAAQNRLTAAVAGDRAHVEAIDAQIADARNQLSSVPASGTSIGAIRALRDAAESQYQSLALRVSNAEANSAESNSLGEAVVIDRAVKAEKSLIGAPAILTLGILVALALAIAAAYAAESLDPRLLGPADLERVYGRPTLANLRAR